MRVALAVLLLVLLSCAPSVENQSAPEAPESESASQPEVPVLRGGEQGGETEFYAFAAPVQAQGAEDGLLLEYSGRLAHAEILLYPVDDGPPVHRTLQPPRAESETVEWRVPVPSGVSLRGFRLRTKAESGELRLHTVALRPLQPGLAIGAGRVTGAEILLEATQAAAPGPHWEGVPAHEVLSAARLSFGPFVHEFDTQQYLPILELVYEYRRSAALFQPGRRPSVQATELILRGLTRETRYVLGFNPGRNAVHLHLHDLGEPVHELLLTNSEAEFRIVSAAVQGLARRLGGAVDATPVPADLGQIIEYDRALWRRPEFELFSWSAYPEIHIIDFGELATQSAFFKRLAFFVEKDTFTGRLLSNVELEGKHGWNAHNYSGTGLAAFFNAAAAESFSLNPEEELLRELMLERGVIRLSSSTDGDEPYLAGPGGVISFSRELPHLRRVFLTHEAMHGLFYMVDEFRNYSFQYWDALSEEERRFWRSFFQYRDFDPSDEYLMVNEFQAYLLQQEPERATEYFTNTWIWRFREAQPRDAGWVNELLSVQPEMFSQPAHDLNRVLWQYSGYRGGDVLRLRRLRP